ncbi:MAG TPA: efflux RND transporter periplasmic adaptor subunit [Candidatus Saccharimonadia bacterium]|nr:efflux RND transporter periplasmic adaptor subunit [Candidatus Saccharimonadia bacterium]
MKTPLTPLSLLSVALALAACQPEAPQMPPPPPTAVTVASPVKQKVKEWDEFTGRIDAAESVMLYSQVTGYLMSIHFKDGTEVKKGTLLFQIDPRPFQAVLDQALAQHEQAKVKLELSRSEYDRAAKLLDSKAISAEDYDTRSKAVREAEAGLKVSQAAVDKAKLDVEYTQIKAPLDGRIGRKLMDVGGLVVGGPMGATALTSIVSLDPINCYIDADELTVLRYQKLNREDKGLSARDDEIPCEMALANDTGFPHKGVIDFVDNRLDPTTGTIQVRAVFQNPKPERGQRVLQPGYFARVRVPGGSDYEAFVIDDKAVQSDQAQKIVYVVDEKNIVMPRPIDVGPVINGKRVVRNGLTEKDRVIVNGMAKIGPGMPVTPMTEAEVAKAQQTAQADAPATPSH